MSHLSTANAPHHKTLSGTPVPCAYATELSLSCHGEALPKGIYARRQERNLILAHLSIIYNMLLYIAAKLMN